VLRKSKPESIKFSAARNALVLAVLGLLLSAGVAGARNQAALIRISTDTLVTPGAQHASQVEPDAAAEGSTIVSAFQVGRFFDGGAAAIGFSTSLNAGRTWRSGILPTLTTSSVPAGSASRATDPAVAFDAVHQRWLVESLTLSQSSTAVVVSSSADGLSWDPPVTAISLPRPQRGGEEDTNLDKSWITCDNGAASAFRGRCYIAYTDYAQPGIAAIGVQSTSDGGATWSAPSFVQVSVTVPGVQPVVRPNGQLVLIFLDRPSSLYAARSDDGGLTFSGRERIATVQANQRRLTAQQLRVFPLPSAGVDGGGMVYIAWSDCRFRRGCSANDIVVARSTASGWTRPRRVLVRGLGPNASHVLPGLGVDAASRAGRARLALTFYTVRNARCAPARCLLDVRMTTSANAGATWSAAPRLNQAAMRFAWLPETSSGHMVGDYFATEFSGNRAVGIFALAGAPRGGRLNQSIHAAVRTFP
jgi:hypothetical protein